MSEVDEIRLAQQEDAPACAKIINDWIDKTPWMARSEPRAAIEEILRDGIPKREFYVIGDPIRGYLSLDPSSNLIGGFYLAKQGQGLGKALLDRAKQGRSYMQLWTHEPNHGAQKFYRREGFVAVERDPERSPVGVVEIRMEWRT
ncbi:MAG: GNAT family N-acetyltransferase [Pseudomonadota bacterium]